MKRFALYLSQDNIDELGSALWQLQTLVNIASSDRPTSNLPTRLLTELRLQCSATGAADPLPDFSYEPRIFEGEIGPSGGVDEVTCV